MALPGRNHANSYDMSETQPDTWRTSAITLTIRNATPSKRSVNLDIKRKGHWGDLQMKDADAEILKTKAEFHSPEDLDERSFAVSNTEPQLSV
jgi:hypothetical protein